MERRDILTWLAVVAIILVAIWFRFYDIQNYPPGLFPDEAANGEDALLVNQGDVRAFYPRGNGREGLYFLMEAMSIKNFGIGAWQLHAVSALIGVLTVIATYFGTRIWFGRLAGLLAALFLATNHWHVTMSRTGFRAILIPLFVAAFTAFAGYAIDYAKKKKMTASIVNAALAGATFMGGFYTYIAYRVMIGVVLGITILLLLAALHPKIGFPHLKRYWKQLIAAVIAGLIVFAPLGWFFIQQPDAFIGRAGQVSVFNESLQQEGGLVPTIIFVTRETLLSFFVGEGDLNWRHNVAGFPLLNLLVGGLFLLGLAWALRGTYMVAYKIFKGDELHLGMIYPYALLLLLGMILPVITTAEGIPHGLRSIGLVFPIFFLAGMAGAVVLHWMQRRSWSFNSKAAVFGLSAGLIVLFSIYDGVLYFMISRNDAEAHYEYRADLTEVAKYINNYVKENPERTRPYLVLDKFSLQTIHFLTAVEAHEYTVGDEPHPDVDRHKWEQVDPETSHLTELKAGEIMIFTQSTIFDTKRYLERYPNIVEIDSRTNRFGEEILRVYSVLEGES